MPINSFLYPGVKVPPPFSVTNSLRFDDGSSEYLHRTPSSSGSSTNWTYSVWVKRSASISGDQRLLSNGNQQGSGSQDTGIIFMSDDTLRFDIYDNGTTRGNIDTKRTFRDLGAWYHFVFVWNSSSSTSTMNGSATDRMQIWVNGVQETELEGHTGSAPTIPAQDANDPNTNSTSYAMRIGTRATNQYFNGYIAEAVFLDGQSLGASSFGEFDEDSGIWKPKDVSGLTFGTNGFYLDFEDSSALGNDVSGNNNDFTVNNLTSIDQSTDTCTNNFATMNALDNYYASSDFSDGNITVDMNDSGNETYNTSTFAVSTGKWYAEVKLVDSSTKPMTGISGNNPVAIGTVLGNSDHGYAYQGENGQMRINGANQGAYGNTYTTNDIIGIALDLDNNKLYFSKNGTWQNSGDPTSGATGTGAVSIDAPSSTAVGAYFFAAGKRHSDNNKVSWNFGSPPYSISSGNSDGNGYGNFEYSVPSGYYALNTKNLAEYG